MKRLSAHLQRPRDPTSLEILRAQLDSQVHVTVGPELPTPADYHVLVAGRPERERITASPDLRTLIIPWAGLPEVTRELLSEFPHIAVHNLHHNAVPAAEMAVALMLAASKRVVPADRAMRNHDWTPRYESEPSVLLEARTVLVLGYGAIGQWAGRVCRGLGMRVLAVRRNVVAPTDGVAEEIHQPAALHRLLARADVLLICLPHTPETTGLIGEKELALMPPGAILVNVGRGPIVDEHALYTALRDGRLYGAGLDVWYNYPRDEASRSQTPPSAQPFHELENVVMSPHRAGHSSESEERRMVHLATLLNAAARDEEIPNRVDLQVGY
jgi:phosphoglycerate dehydrogenase-like enzyme